MSHISHKYLDPKLNQLMESIKKISSDRLDLISHISEDIKLIETTFQQLQIGIEIKTEIPIKDSEVYYFGLKKDDHKKYRLFLINATTEHQVAFIESKIQPRIKFYPFLYLLLEDLHHYISHESISLKNISAGTN